MEKVVNHVAVQDIEQAAEQLLKEYVMLDDKPICFFEVRDPQWRKLFDRALDEIHYAGACQRVGRCMRLAIIEHENWVGGIVLGSTFPNIPVRDEVLVG